MKKRLLEIMYSPNAFLLDGEKITLEKDYEKVALHNTGDELMSYKCTEDDFIKVLKAYKEKNKSVYVLWGGSKIYLNDRWDKVVCDDWILDGKWFIED